MRSFILASERRATVPLALAVLGAICLTAFPAAADYYTAPRKFGRGLAGMTTSFLEVPGNMVAWTHAHGVAEGMPLGLAKDLGMIDVRTPVDVYETLSAPFPVPDGYRPIIRLEYPWSYFEERDRRAEIDPSGLPLNQRSAA